MESIVKRIYDDMRIRILKGEFNANSFFVENGIADMYGVSRGTAREAMLLLCEGKYLVKHPRKGYFLYQFTEKELMDICFVRFHLEMAGIRIVIADRTDEEIRSLYNVLDGAEVNYLPEEMDNYRFHMALAELSGNQRIPQILSELLDCTSRNYVSTQSSISNVSHKHIIEALLNRNIIEIGRLLAIDLSISEKDTYLDF